jgi:RHS repeat-associated protein
VYQNGHGKTRWGNLQTDHRFTGQKYDATGLYYFNARYYDPVIGTFISPDTLVPDPTNIWDYNRFLYARGNPMKYNDPTGRASGPMVHDSNAGPPVVLSSQNVAHIQEDYYNLGVSWENLPSDVHATMTANNATGYMDFHGNAVSQNGTLADPAVLGASVVAGWRLGSLAYRLGSACWFGDCASKLQQATASSTTQSVWRLNPYDRGVAIENMLGRSPFLAQNFPVIDRFENGVATSIKSMDLTLKSYQNLGTLERTVRGYVTTVANWQGANWAGYRIDVTQIQGREVLLAIPQGASQAQMGTLLQLQQWATTVGVTLNIVPIP